MFYLLAVLSMQVHNIYSVSQKWIIEENIRTCVVHEKVQDKKKIIV